VTLGTVRFASDLPCGLVLTKRHELAFESLGLDGLVQHGNGASRGAAYRHRIQQVSGSLAKPLMASAGAINASLSDRTCPRPVRRTHGSATLAGDRSHGARGYGNNRA
jgi:hypothetical protein